MLRFISATCAHVRTNARVCTDPLELELQAISRFLTYGNAGVSILIVYS